MRSGKFLPQVIQVIAILTIHHPIVAILHRIIPAPTLLQAVAAVVVLLPVAVLQDRVEAFQGLQEVVVINLF